MAILLLKVQIKIKFKLGLQPLANAKKNSKIYLTGDFEKLHKFSQLQNKNLLPQ